MKSLAACCVPREQEWFVGKEALWLIVGRDMTADAGLASDSSETDFRLAAVLGSSSGSSCVYLCIVCIYLYTQVPLYSRRAIGSCPGQ